MSERYRQIEGHCSTHTGSPFFVDTVYDAELCGLCELEGLQAEIERLEHAEDALVRERQDRDADRAAIRDVREFISYAAWVAWQKKHADAIKRATGATHDATGGVSA